MNNLSPQKYRANSTYRSKDDDEYLHSNPARLYQVFDAIFRKRTASTYKANKTISTDAHQQIISVTRTPGTNQLPSTYQAENFNINLRKQTIQLTEIIDRTDAVAWFLCCPRSAQLALKTKTGRKHAGANHPPPAKALHSENTKESG